MKKAKAPSAKTQARKAKEAAMIAWAKQQHAQFRADLREMFARERQKKQQEPGGPGGTGITGQNQIPAPRVIPTEQEMKAVSEAARKYIDSLDTPQGKLGTTPTAPKMTPDNNSLSRKVDALLQQKKQGPALMDTAPKPAGEMRQYLVYDPTKYKDKWEASQYTTKLIPYVVDIKNASRDEVDYLNRALANYANNARLYDYTVTLPQQIQFTDNSAKQLESKNPNIKYQAVFAANTNLKQTIPYNGNEVPYLGKMEIVPGFNLNTLEQDSQQAKSRGEASTSSKYHRFNHEMGHNEHRATYPDSFLHPDKRIADGADESYIYSHVSHYPRTYWGKDYTTYIQEVFAEIWAMVVNGDTLDAGVQEIFNRIKENRPK